VILAVTVSRIVAIVIGRMSMCVISGKWGLLKKMMDPMGRGRSEKENKKRNDSQSASGSRTTKCFPQYVDNYIHRAHSNLETLADARWIGRPLDSIFLR
jgi:hypothetical protein